MLRSPQLFSCTSPNFGNAQESHQLICYEWKAQTPSDLPPVLCVHGLTRNGRDFDYLASELSQTRNVISLDMPGRGKSDYLNDAAGYSYPAYVADIFALLKSRAIPQVDWVGTSMGGIIAMVFAAQMPGVIRKLVMNDVGMLIPAAGLKRILTYAGSVPSFASRTEAESAFRARTATFGITNEEHWRHLFEYSLIQNADGSWTFAYDPKILPPLDSNIAVQDVDFWQLWPALEKLPILLLRGAQSDILTHDTALQMKQRGSSLTLRELEGIGHAPALMDDAQISLITEFLNQ